MRLIAFVAIAALALVPRVVALDDRGFNSDEAVYAGQAAAMIGNAAFEPHFPVFRAHPLLVQTGLAIVYGITGVSDIGARLFSVALGLATVAAVMWAGARLYGWRVGSLAAALFAVMPYHVIVSRQFLLDGPMTLVATITLGCFACFGSTSRGAWLVAGSAAFGLTFLAKETSIILVGAMFAFIALTPEITIRRRDLAAGALAFGLVILAFPIAITLAATGATRTAGDYLLWQLFRPPNHDLLFYPLVVAPAMGVLLVATAALSLLSTRRVLSWREKLLLLWIVVPVAFFELWPTKGFQYLLPAAPAVAILAGRWIVTSPFLQKARYLRPAFAIVIGVSMLVPTAIAVLAAPTIPIAGSGGVVGGRDAGHWLEDNSTSESRVMTIGPSMANLVQFYGHRSAQGLSVSPNPIRRNPSYTPIRNPDLALRQGEFDFVVWDAVSAGRSPRFSSRLLELVRRYDGVLVSEFPASGASLIRIYRLPPRPAAPSVEPARTGARFEVIALSYGLATLISVSLVLRAALGDRRGFTPAHPLRPRRPRPARRFF